MNNAEYESMVKKIVSGGRGYEAIKDIVRLLQEEVVERDAVTREAAAERRAIKKICDADQTPKQKVDAIRAICD